MKLYRLKQPLFGDGWPDPIEARKLRELILTYDVIYNLLFPPGDMNESEIQQNAKAVLELFGNKLELTLGSEIFEQEEDTQLSFNFGGDENGKL